MGETRDDRQKYLSYLLRLWEVSAAPGEDAIWRASVECVQGGERMSFASLDDLLAYLRDQTRRKAGPRTATNELEPGQGRAPIGGYAR